MKFIKIGNAYYDYHNYKTQALAIESAAKDEIETGLRRFGFEKNKKGVFYNKKLDLVLQILIFKKSKLKFV
ncbi:MAG TPA: hypothetical protein ENN30_02815 [Candidatus Woesearchaeota archaeon]|nr:hypothetical protein [Candidatus Woesearchaeota archaeon]